MSAVMAWSVSVGTLMFENSLLMAFTSVGVTGQISDNTRVLKWSFDKLLAGGAGGRRAGRASDKRARVNGWGAASERKEN